MTSQASEDRRGVTLSVPAVFLLSAAVILLELALMRCLSIARWHHFAYLVISTALLGFGASGTLLFLVGARLRRHYALSSAALALLFALSVTVCFRAAEALPLDARYVVYSGRQAGLMFAYHLLLLVPFLLGGSAVGLALMHAGERSHLVYAANLIGSGAGAALALGLMFAMPAPHLLYVVSALGAAAALVWAARHLVLLAACAAAIALGFAPVRAPLPLRIDQYKKLAVLRRWEADGGARHLMTRYGPRAQLDVYDSPRLHDTLFAGLTATTAPPPQLAILADGDLAATVYKVTSADEAEILDHTPAAVPYRLVDRPRVLLLGEGGGTNVWLARRMGARSITVVQSNPQIVGLMRGPLAQASGDVLDGPDVRVVVTEPRTYLERCDEQFDLIQIVTAEGMPASSGGLLSLNEDHLLTEQGMALALARLRRGGLLAVTRGIQAPPRDAIKLFATLRAALEDAGAPDPGRQLFMVRNPLAVTSAASADPLTAEQCAALLAAARTLALDVEWAPCEGIAYDGQVNEEAGPEGRPYSWFHDAAVQLLSADREPFLRGWVYDVRPATDDSPYFHNFFRWRSLPYLMRAYGREWLQRSELGYVVVAFVLAEVVIAGVVLILLPILLLKRARAAPGRLATGAYFALIGLAYLMLEMACLLKFTRFLGDPIYAAAVVICGFLVSSGLGSVVSRWPGRSPRHTIGLAALGVAFVVLSYVVALDLIFQVFIGLPLAGRLVLALALTAPPAFLMGWFFPNGLAQVERGAPSLVPWAWGVNGLASVAASPLAVMIAVASGYRTVLLLVIVLYLLAGVVSFALPGAAGRE